MEHEHQTCRDYLQFWNASENRLSCRERTLSLWRNKSILLVLHRLHRFGIGKPGTIGPQKAPSLVGKLRWIWRGLMKLARDPVFPLRACQPNSTSSPCLRTSNFAAIEVGKIIGWRQQAWSDLYYKKKEEEGERKDGAGKDGKEGCSWADGKGTMRVRQGTMYNGLWSLSPSAAKDAPAVRLHRLGELTSGSL